MSQEDENLKYNIDLIEKASKEGDIYIDENGIVWIRKRKENKEDEKSLHPGFGSIQGTDSSSS